MIPRAIKDCWPAAVAILVAAAATSALFPADADAHGLIGRADLPLPEWLLAWGVAVLLIISFAGLVVLWREPKLEQDFWRPLSERFSALLINPATEILAGLIGVGLLILTIYSGLTGTVAPDRNFAVTFVFVTLWLGMVGVSVALGNVFKAFNPWRAIGRAASAGFRLIAGQSAPTPFTYPERLGRWPAVVGLLGFVWFELVWGQSGFAAAGVSPHDIAIAGLVYTAITFIGMALFGVEDYSEKGETFSVYFGMFAGLSVFEVREGRVGVRRFLSGTTGWAGPAGSLALVLVAIGATSFDGAQEGALKDAITSTFESFTDAGLSPIFALRLANTLFFAGALAAVFGIFWAGIEGMRIVGTKRKARELGSMFAHAFIPIALAYLVAHYFSLVAFQEQAQFTYLLSDPLGEGSNIFGTAGSAIDYTVVSATAIRWIQFGAIVVGHALALAIGHDRALAIFGNTRDASWSQLWMLVVMLIFSMLALFLLTQANA